MKKTQTNYEGNIIIGSKSIAYFLKYSNRKTIEIKIRSDGQIYISAPFYASNIEIEKVLIKKSSWISDKLEAVRNLEIEEKKSLLNIDTILVNGIETPLIISRSSIKRYKIEKNEYGLFIQIPEGFKDNDANHLIAKILTDFYIANTKKYIYYRLKYFEDCLGVKANKVAIKNQKSRWGSCSSKLNINLNLKLSMTPDYVFDYVIVHELCHLKELNHSKQFWSLLKEILPNYELAKEWLKKNSSKLMII